MTASLPMYETEPMRPALDRFWDNIRIRYKKGPTGLDRSTDPHETWLDPQLVLSQTCGLPYRTSLFDKVRLVGTPDYGLEGCPPGYYRSHIIVRAADPRTSLADFHRARLARNDVRSQSGWAAVLAHFEEEAPGLGLSEDILETGSHLKSLRAVRSGQADIAGVDAVTWALLARDTDDTAGLRQLASTRPSPGLPLITGLREDAPRLRAAVSDAIAALTAEDRACLMLRDLVAIPSETYRAVPTPSK